MGKKIKIILLHRGNVGERASYKIRVAISDKKLSSSSITKVLLHMTRARIESCSDGV